MPLRPAAERPSSSGWGDSDSTSSNPVDQIGKSGSRNVTESVVTLTRITGQEAGDVMGVCSICQETVDVVDVKARQIETTTTPCNHHMHSSCLSDYFRQIDIYPEQKVWDGSLSYRLSGSREPCPICKTITPLSTPVRNGNGFTWIIQNREVKGSLLGYAGPPMTFILPDQSGAKPPEITVALQFKKVPWLALQSTATDLNEYYFPVSLVFEDRILVQDINLESLYPEVIEGGKNQEGGLERALEEAKARCKGIYLQWIWPDEVGRFDNLNRLDESNQDDVQEVEELAALSHLGRFGRPRPVKELAIPTGLGLKWSMICAQIKENGGTICAVDPVKGSITWCDPVRQQVSLTTDIEQPCPLTDSMESLTLSGNSKLTDASTSWHENYQFKITVEPDWNTAADIDYRANSDPDAVNAEIPVAGPLSSGGGEDDGKELSTINANNSAHINRPEKIECTGFGFSFPAYSSTLFKDAVIADEAFKATDEFKQFKKAFNEMTDNLGDDGSYRVTLSIEPSGIVSEKETVHTNTGMPA